MATYNAPWLSLAQRVHQLDSHTLEQVSSVNCVADYLPMHVTAGEEA